MRNQFKKILEVSFLTVFLLFFLVSSISAQELKNPSGPSVFPSIINLNLKAGDRTKSSFTYINNSDSDQIISLDLRPFIPSNGEKGSPIFTGSNGKTINSPLRDWIVLEKTTYVISAGGKTDVGFSVNIPSNAEVKKYYTAIVAAEKASEADIKGSSISTEIGILVIADVSKSSLSVLNKIKNYPWYFYAMVIAFILAIIVAVIIYRRRD